MNTHEILVAARNLIEREGWAQGGSCDRGRCVSNAIYDSGGFVEKAPREVLADILGVDSSMGLFCWNDTPGRTKEEVLALFDAAIAFTAPPPDTGFLTAEDEPHMVTV